MHVHAGLLAGAILVAGCATMVPSGQTGRTFAVIEATDDIVVSGPSIDRSTECGRPARPYTRIDVANRTVQVVRGNQSLPALAPEHVLFENLRFVDTAEPCPRLTWLFPLQRVETRLLVNIHEHPFLLNVTRDGETVRWEGRPVAEGDRVERSVDFHRNLGGRDYHYSGTIRFVFHGLWSLDHVDEVDAESQLAEGPARPFWHHPPFGSELHVEG